MRDRPFRAGLILGAFFFAVLIFSNCGEGGGDTSPPETTITEAPPDPSDSSAASFEFECDEEDCTFACRLNASSWVYCTPPKIYYGLANDTHTFEVMAIDPEENVDLSPATYTWTVEAEAEEPGPVAPDTVIDSGPEDPSGSSAATFTFSCSGADCTYECRIDFDIWEACTSPREYSGLADGSHTFRVRAMDPENNVDFTPAAYTWTIDTDITPPNTVITLAPPDPSSSAGAAFLFDCTEEDCAYECRLDSGDWEACTSPREYSGLADGSHAFAVRAKDPSDNVDSTPATYDWSIDTAGLDATPPNTAIEDKPTDPIGSNQATFSFACNEGDCTYECRLDWGAWMTCSSPHDYSGLEAGTHTFEVRATDSSGNVDSTPARYEWSIGSSFPLN